MHVAHRCTAREQESNVALLALQANVATLEQRIDEQQQMERDFVALQAQHQAKTLELEATARQLAVVEHDLLEATDVR